MIHFVIGHKVSLKTQNVHSLSMNVLKCGERRQSFFHLSEGGKDVFKKTNVSPSKFDEYIETFTVRKTLDEMAFHRAKPSLPSSSVTLYVVMYFVCGAKWVRETERHA